jgi:hypothetical protein
MSANLRITSGLLVVQELHASALLEKVKHRIQEPA